MVLLSGPRQVGKSYLARALMAGFRAPRYLNYDNAQDRAVIKDEAWSGDTDLLILDELHKLPRWKNYLKGIVRHTTTAAPHPGYRQRTARDFPSIGDSLAGR